MRTKPYQAEALYFAPDAWVPWVYEPIHIYPTWILMRDEGPPPKDGAAYINRIISHFN